MLKCSYCNKEFKYESEKRRHEQSHTPQFECNDCSKKFSFLSALRRHQKQHKRTGSVQCNECGRNFKDDTLLARHFKYAHKGQYICPKCSAKFKSELALSCHMKTHKPKSERKFHCNYYNCDKSFNYLHHLKHHELTHSNVKEHHCNICKKGFIQAHHLKSHLKTHEPESWLHCTAPLCKKAFPTEYALRRHLSTHNTILCSSCGQVTSLSSYEDHLSKCKPYLDVHSKDLSFGTTAMVENNNYLKEKVMDKQILGQLNTLDNSTRAHAQVEEINKNNTLVLSALTDNTSKVHNEIKDAVEKSCEDCDCQTNRKSSNLQDKIVFKDTLQSIFTNDNYPDIEYKSDGTIKLKESIDFEFEVKAHIHEEKNIVENNKFFNMNIVPYNSCKDILGKCIVSGNGTISEGCLCARMAIDNEQIIAEEVDEITPKPISKDVCM